MCWPARWEMSRCCGHASTHFALRHGLAPPHSHRPSTAASLSWCELALPVKNTWGQLQKLIVIQLVNKLHPSPFMELCSQQPGTIHYSEPDESSSDLHTYFLLIHLNRIHPAAIKSAKQPLPFRFSDQSWNIRTQIYYLYLECLLISDLFKNIISSNIIFFVIFVWILVTQSEFITLEKTKPCKYGIRYAYVCVLLNVWLSPCGICTAFTTSCLTEKPRPRGRPVRPQLAASMQV